MKKVFVIDNYDSFTYNLVHYLEELDCNVTVKRNDEFKLDEVKSKAITSANTGVDNMTSLHIHNWMKCVRDRKETNGPVEAAYNHSIATIMTTAALRTGLKATFDEKTQQVIVGGKIFKY